MILGAMAGDMVGSVFEFENAKTQVFPLFCEETAFTDDSVMTLAVASALADAHEAGWLIGEEEPGQLQSSLVNHMRSFGRRYPNVGYGGRFYRWLHTQDPKPYSSWGNGSAMRVSAVAWVVSTPDEASAPDTAPMPGVTDGIDDGLRAVEALAAETARVTHDHPEGIKGAQAAAACAYLARCGVNDDGIREYVQNRFGYALDFTLDQIRPTYTFDVSCQGSVPQAIEAFLEGSSFEDVIRKAVSIGGDSDTIAAIAAGIAQCRYGVPEDIEMQVRRRLPDDLLAANDRFCKLFAVGS